MKLASEIGKIQDGSVFIFDEPSIGLHPKDVKTLLNIFQKLIDNGATIVVIEHDLDVLKILIILLIWDQKADTLEAR